MNELKRFVDAQENMYSTALREIRDGFKFSHWMWYIFPQLRGLGKSDMATYYGISGIKEAKEYLKHPILGARLVKCCESLLSNSNKSAEEIFGDIDTMKLRSSMTLFALAENKQDSIYEKVLKVFFNGNKDIQTVLLCKTALEIAEEVKNFIEELYSVETRKMVLLSRANGESIEDVAKNLGVTNERIRQIEAKYERKFAMWFGKTKIIDKIIEDKQADKVSRRMLKEYFGDHYSEMMYLLHLYKESFYCSDTQLNELDFSEL